MKKKRTQKVYYVAPSGVILKGSQFKLLKLPFHVYPFGVFCEEVIE